MHDHHAPSEHLHDHRSFDERAAAWDDDEKVRNAREIAAAVLDRLDLADDARVLEYGAGTALLTQNLRPCLGHAVLTDVSDGMLAVMREKVATGVITDAEVRRLDLVTDPVERTDAGAYDLVCSMLALHHVPDVPAALRGMYALLKPGGHLAVADLDAEDGSFHNGGAGVQHHGFDRAELEALLRDAGFADIAFATATQVIKHGEPYAAFLVTATGGGQHPDNT